MRHDDRYGDSIAFGGMAMRFISFLALFILLTSIGLAESAPAAGWRGVLRNPGGAPIANAKVELRSNGAKAEGRTGSDGRFQLEALPAGSYHLTIATNGADPYTSTGNANSNATSSN